MDSGDRWSVVQRRDPTRPDPAWLLPSRRTFSIFNFQFRFYSGVIQPAKFICPFSILIIATGLTGFRSAPMEIVPETP
jgi:hypothetical protein